MKKFLVLIALAVATASTVLAKVDKESIYQEINASTIAPHPRLFAHKLDMKKILSNPVSKGAHDIVIEQANEFEKLEPLPRTLIGVRMLQCSRNILNRVFYLSYAYRATGEKRFAVAAEREMLNACNYENWNPRHFLDVAELTLGMAIGYDWLYDYLSEESKAKILDSVKNKALLPSEKHHFWRLTNNWRQVCFGGMTAGALMLLDSPENAEYAKRYIARCAAEIDVSYAQYEPDGVYAEGIGYWEYGTCYHVLLIAMLESSFGKNFGVEAKGGFKKAAQFAKFAIAPSGKFSNFSDCPEKAYLSIPLIWLNQNSEDNSSLFPFAMFLDNLQKKEFPNIGDHGVTVSNKSPRYLPFAIPYLAEIKLGEIPQPKEKLFVGHGNTEVAIVRTSWTDKNTIYLAAKGGNKYASHYHLDRGSFILEMLGERWAVDLHVLPYNYYESLGVNFFGNRVLRNQMLRVGNSTHSTLTVNDAIFHQDASAPIVESFDTEAFRGAKMNTSELYAGELAKAFRTFAVVDNAKILIRDELSALPDKPAKVRWNMMTSAKVDIIDNQTIKLSQNGKSVVMRAKSDVKFVAKVFDCPVLVKGDKPITEAQAIGFEFTLTAKKSSVFKVEISESK